jgi:hypothetical protein
MVSSYGYETVNAHRILTITAGLLIYIPGFSEEGILLALAGGSNETFVSTPGPGSTMMLTDPSDANEQHRRI